MDFPVWIFPVNICPVMMHLLKIKGSFWINHLNWGLFRGNSGDVKQTLKELYVFALLHGLHWSDREEDMWDCFLQYCKCLLEKNSVQLRRAGWFFYIYGQRSAWRPLNPLWMMEQKREYKDKKTYSERCPPSLFDPSLQRLQARPTMLLTQFNPFK